METIQIVALNLLVLVVLVEYSKGHPSSMGFEQTPQSQRGAYRDQYESPGPTQNVQYIPLQTYQQPPPEQPYQQSTVVQPQPRQQSEPVYPHSKPVPDEPHQHQMPINHQESMPVQPYQQSEPVYAHPKPMTDDPHQHQMPINHQESMPVQPYQQSEPVYAHPKPVPDDPHQHQMPINHQESTPVQLHQQPAPVQSNQPQISNSNQPASHQNQPQITQSHPPASYENQPQVNSIPTHSQTDSKTYQYEPYQPQLRRNQAPQQFRRQNTSYPYQTDRASYQYNYPGAASRPQQSPSQYPSQNSQPQYSPQHYQNQNSQPQQPPHHYQSLNSQPQQPPHQYQSQNSQPDQSPYHSQSQNLQPQQSSHQYQGQNVQPQHHQQSLPINKYEQKPSNNQQRTEAQQQNYGPGPEHVPEHNQNKLPHQQTKPDFGYTTQLKQVTNTVDSVPIPYMKYDKDESPVFHYGHDDLDKEYGDRKVVQGEFPYFVQIRTNSEHICGGALIRSPVTGKQVVITAQHCLVTPYTSKLLSPHQITLRMGILGVDDIGQERKAAVVLTHLAYTLFSQSKRPVFNDIGMVIPDFEFNLNEHVQFVDLPEVNLPTQWHDVNIKGFGTGREAGHMETTKFMRTISVPVWDNEVCNKAYFEESGVNLITDGHFCAAHRTGGLDSCQGDSGGPATAVEKGKLYLVGIVSWGKGCGKIAYPGVYVRVWSYLNWIKMTLFDFEINGVIPRPPKYPQ